LGALIVVVLVAVVVVVSVCEAKVVVRKVMK
jgi:hypothetical protein